MYRHHIEARVKLHVSKELSCNPCASTQGHTVHQLSPRPLLKIILKIPWQARHEDYQHAEERNSGVEHGDTRSRIYIWQDRRKEYQQSDEENSLASTGKPVAKAKPIHIFGMHVAGSG